MSSSPNLTTEDGLREYLEAENRPNEVSIAMLSGGSANYVYRVSGIHDPPCIFKHAAPYLHSNTNFALDATRMNYEARALEIFAHTTGKNPLSDLSPRPAVHAAHLLSYDKENKLLCIEDGGSRNLKDAYNDPELDIAKIGRDLATWIANLHLSSTDTSLVLSDQEKLTAGKNNPIAVSIYRYSYLNLRTALSEYGHDSTLADKINEDFGGLLSTDDECVCHGDFWPGNVLVRAESGYVSRLDRCRLGGKHFRYKPKHLQDSDFKSSSWYAEAPVRLMSANFLLRHFCSIVSEAIEGSSLLS